MKVRDVQRRADRAAAHFDAADFVPAMTREGLLRRLAPLTIDAATVLDLGAATGAAGRPLAKRFPGAQVVAVDLSRAMLRASRRRRWFGRGLCVQADARALPFAAQSVDVIFANLLLPWTDEPLAVFREAARVLRAEGVLAFSTLGPDSLAELREAWERVDGEPRANPFVDMHDLGDAAVRAGLRDPVLDVDRVTVTYETPERLFGDLAAVGSRRAPPSRRTLTGRGRFDRMLAALEDGRRGGLLGVGLELVYGHCFGPGPRAAGEVRVSAETIGRRRP